MLAPTRDRDRVGALFGAVGEATRQRILREGMAFAMNEHKLASLQMRREDFAPAEGRAVGYEDLQRHSARWLSTKWLLA
jgi:hypothetical protein